MDDTTQNYGLNGEYVGTSPWGQRYSFKLAYTGSQYTDNYSSYTVQSPYHGSTMQLAIPDPIARMSLWPSNQVNALAGRWAPICHGRAAMSARSITHDAAECGVHPDDD